MAAALSETDGACRSSKRSMSAVPIQTVYNQWTQFEEWPNFMHRLDRVSQEDETHVSFKAKIWGISREFKAEIVDQRPDERIKWRVTEGVSHTGVVTFHELSDRLTRVEIDVYIEPGSLLEKAGRGMRHAKRAIRADMARFKAYMELEEEATGAWRGAIDDGEVKSTRRSSQSRAASSGSRSRAASSGSRSKPASSGSRSSGSRSTAASSGSRSKAASSGPRAKAASSGSRSKPASSGPRAKAASSGSRPKAASSGSRSKPASSGSRGGTRSSGQSKSSGSRAASSGRTSSSGRKTSGSRS